MSVSIRDALIGAGVVTAVAAAFAALFQILGGEPTTIIPWNRECPGGNPECLIEPLPVCADCLKCHDTLDQCVYSLKNDPGCPCVEHEMKPCAVFGVIPGKKTCNKINPDATSWGTCKVL